MKLERLRPAWLMKIRGWTREGSPRKVGSFGALPMNRSGVDAVGSVGQDVFGYGCDSSPLRPMNLGGEGNGKFAANGIANSVELQDQIMPCGCQLDFRVVTICPKDEQLHDLVFPQTVSGTDWH